MMRTNKNILLLAFILVLSLFLINCGPTIIAAVASSGGGGGDGGGETTGDNVLRWDEGHWDQQEWE